MKNYIGISRDHSGSMAHIASAAALDYNENISSIKEEASTHNIDTIVSVVKCGFKEGYNSVTKNVFDVTNSNVSALNPIPENGYIATGTKTPLFDSVEMLINQMSVVPDANDADVSFVVMVITDGQDNASKVSANQLATRIKELQKTDRWTFIFRVPKGDKNSLVHMGIPAGNILEWEQSEKGVKQATTVTRSAFKGFYTARAAGAKSTDKFYADLSDVTIKEVKAQLVDISNQVDVFKVKSSENGIQIRDFVEQRTSKPFVKGSAFYQLTKTETIQEYKQISIRDKKTLTVYSGFAARDLLGLPHTGEVKIAPGQHGQYDIFIQSTSVNRKLVENTNVLVWNT